VIVQPIYRLKLPTGALGGGGLVDMKVVRQETAGTITRGKIYVNWEDSEQGGDYDQDMWGTLEWVLDAAASIITITTTAVAESTSNTQGFGYAISGTTQDGPHFHSGIEGFSYSDPTGVLGCTNCQVLGNGGQSGPTTVTYRLGPSTGKTLQDPMWYAAKYGAFIDSNGNGVPDLQSEWDSKLANGQQAPNGDGNPDTYFLVTNPLGLVAALDRAFIAILSNASASSVATNSTSLQTGTTIYQARFNANDWSGQVLAFAVDTQGQIAKDPTWDAGQIVNAQDPFDNTSPPAKAVVSTDVDVIKGSGRSIITFNPTSKTGVPFRWPKDPANPDTATEISKTLVDALNLGTTGKPPSIDNRGRERLEYLRGSQKSEGAGVLGFRVRPISRLGDIVNSNPNFVGAPNSGFGDDLYTKFRQDNIDRKPMIYVGGNDGMLHGFRAEDGREVLAYIPSMIHKKLNVLTDKTYIGNLHRYFVDGSPEIGDAFINVGGTNGWHTVLVSALGGGAQGVFALDVTKPGDFSEANASKIALWEFTDKDDPDLGFIYAQPTIRRMANGKFAAIVPGGYNASKPEPGLLPGTDELACTDSASRTPTGCTTSSTGSAYLFIIFLDGPGADGVWDEGTDYIKIRAADSGDGPSPADGPNGLTQPLAADVDADGFVDFIYAGDLRGNLWKFDVRLPANPDTTKPPVPNPGAALSTWTSGDNRVILFVARDPITLSRQPITGKPEATLHPGGNGFIVTFGTGKYLERNDPYPPSGPPPAVATPYQTQSFYGIWDKNDAKPIAKASADPTLAPAPRQTVVTNRNQLLPHVIATANESSAIRVVVQATGEKDAPDWSAYGDPTVPPPNASDSPPKHMGWVLDFPKATDTGERSVFRPILTAGRLIFTTLLPNTEACQFGGTSFTMVIDPTTGGRIDAPVLDTDANAKLNTNDVVTFGTVKGLYASGLQSTIGITPTPTIIRAGSLPPDKTTSGSQILGTSGPLVAASGVLLAYALAAGSSGGNASTMIGLSAAGGRVSWRELTSD
jgi:type IV pilus assembly protein PilY1